MTGRVIVAIVAVVGLVSAAPFIFSTSSKTVHSWIPPDPPYSVRADWLVAQTPTGAQPTEPYQAGTPPLYLLNCPPEQWSPATALLAAQVKTGAILDTRKLDAGAREECGKVLAELFGSQGQPRVPEGEWLIEQLGLRRLVGELQQAQRVAAGEKDNQTAAALEETIFEQERRIADLTAYVTELRLDSDSLKEGRARFQKFCINCHGPTGAGDGYAARWQTTLARDYRRGIFKFISTDPNVAGKHKPSRSDLYHTIFFGTEEASPMPQFSVAFTDAQLQQVVSYVIHLSMVGETEYEVLKGLLSEQNSNMSAAELRRALIKQQAEIASSWIASARARVLVKPDPYVTDEQKINAAVRGHKLFIDSAVGCMTCHPRYGRQELYWFDSWGSIVRTRDLTQPDFCGGNKPETLYTRFVAGMPGSNMPSYAKLRPTEEERANGIDKIWQLVHFTRFVSNCSEFECWQTLRDKGGLDLAGEAGPLNLPEQRKPRPTAKRTGGKR